MLCLPVTARRLPTTPTPPRWLGDTHLYSEDAADLDEAVMLIRRAHSVQADLERAGRA
ncbi:MULTISPECIES: hypothetical protein [Mycolicibacterium]|uniref:Uncharacterized protein n=1 Tax=Mycolicibacterium mageritense TaxID=53462 RepID=A0AAI8TQT3_MYCME|nr:hypothetical protein [Mycolicibacterium mageritense]CDO23349.1 hypothetical protein BN978_03831 [Mycolicibacterium mageritense DSM 44476 = CIP 104973]MCC9185650.1 hypothetical protein [Mycolicibacterium mageritense]BBX32103.1 hypothetical protein MMAGJ_13850 [Mycolicibacterium mageritense]BDY29208.1 hypothetical protein hbim_03146 [Mycolicibacterium mageritense]GJJ18705.1 hypothetical protein MTY414_23780 [Mycolicibacterium mageritense]